MLLFLFCFWFRTCEKKTFFSFSFTFFIHFFSKDCCTRCVRLEFWCYVRIWYVSFIPTLSQRIIYCSKSFTRSLARNHRIFGQVFLFWFIFLLCFVISLHLLFIFGFCCRFDRSALLFLRHLLIQFGQF